MTFRAQQPNNLVGPRAFIAALLSASLLLFVVNSALGEGLVWKPLPPLPDHEGFAGPFAGTSGGALLVAGGANFPVRKPWDGGVKSWYDTVFALEKPEGPWRRIGKLPRPLGYGLSVTAEEGVLCAGGSDARRHYPDAFLMSWRDGKLHRRKMPPLPSPCANMCGAIVGRTLYVAGGIPSPSATNALKTFWALDLSARTLCWSALEPWPGPARMLAVAGADDESFYLFSGVALRSDGRGKVDRTYLRDAYSFSPANGWRRLPDLPRAAAAAPSPAPLVGGRLLIISGDDGASVDFEPKSRHPGFPLDVLAYEPRNESWTNLGSSPLSRATVPTVEWRGLTVIPNGEMRPGVRSNEVWGLSGEETHP